MLASTHTRKPASVDELISPSLAAALDQLDLRTRQRFAGRLQGERRSKARGRSVEFEDYRPYVPGDDLRHIDWNVFARLDRFFIKIFQEEQDLAVHVVLDASASMDAGNPNKLLFAQRLAMAIGYLALVNQNRLCAWVFSTGDRGTLRALAPMRGRTSVQRLAQFLLDQTFDTSRASPLSVDGPLSRDESVGADRASADAAGPDSVLASRAGLRTPTFAAACRLIASSRAGRGVVVLISDLLAQVGATGDIEAGLSYLGGVPAPQAGANLATSSTSPSGSTDSGRAPVMGGSGTSASSGGWDTTAIQVLAPGEIDPATELDGAGSRVVIGDLRLTDAETGRLAEVTVTADLLERYRANFERYQQNLARACAARSISLVTTRSDADIQSLLVNDLRRRGLLG